MEVEFVRIPERQSEALVHLGARVFCLPSPGNFRIVPPHDLGHFVVEQALQWQTGFWGYIARGVMFPSMFQKAGTRPPHGEERSKAAIRGAKDQLGEGESLADAVATIVRGNLDDNPDRIRQVFNDRWWPPGSTATRLSVSDIQRACRALRQAEADWHSLAMMDALRFRWSFRANPLAPPNPLDETVRKRRQR